MNKWTKKFPTEVGYYFFYGWLFLMERNQDEQIKERKPEFTMIQIFKVSNGVMTIAKGNFVYENDTIGMYKKINMEEINLPDLKQFKVNS